ncbi:unnamed protein product [Adineta steineri]|uniref:Peptidase S9 prolyl oligopeptidase catalytic domain-containing protein n=4 Tax=Adineta steineri TaxID=433720 RepID=A0A819SYD6_9BILA|nr:unnamed protein product [Adineta steineri]
MHCPIVKWYLLSTIFLFDISLNFINCQTCTPLNTWPIIKPNWSNCSVLSDGTFTINNIHAECMLLNVPIHWNLSNLTTCTETIQIYVKRYFLLGYEHISHHLWRIPGGGGIPVSSLEFEAVTVVGALNGSVSVYVTDKRSVGESSRLECPTSIVQNFTGCLSFIKENEYRLKQNTYTNTAHDLEYVLNVVMGKNRENLKTNQRVILMGSSQGTYLLQRYLHVTQESEQVDAVIFDSVLPPDTTRLVYGDKYLNYIFLDLFTRCSQDQQGCAKYFEDNNPLRALYTYKMNEDFFDNSSCLYLLKTNTTELANKMSFILFPEAMQLLPALIYRINRCNQDDQNVLKNFLNVTQPPEQDGAIGYSILVELNNNLAELWSPLNLEEKNPTCEYLKGISSNTFTSTNVMPDIYCEIEKTKILGYPTDQYYRKYPTKKTNIPMLLLHGDMDQALPLSIPRNFFKQYSMINPNFIYIEMPRTGHTALGGSPMVDEEGTCGWNIAVSFMLSPTFEPDRSCLKKISPIDFAGTTTKAKQIAIQYFGTDNIWVLKMNQNGCTNFEDLSNEIIYEIFDFLDTYQAYEIFSNLNIRFRNLLTLSDLSINVNIFNISKLSFEQHYEQFFKYNTHRIHSLYISNPIVIDLIFASIKNDILLTRLRILCLKNIDLNDCKDFFDYLVLLPQLSTLIIYSYKKDCDRIIIYDKLFRLPALKYCKLSLNDSSNFPWEVFSTAYDTVSPIEHLIIDCNVYFNELLHILPYVPHLRRLSIKSLTSSYGQVPHKFSFTLNNLTHVSIELHLINFDQFQPFMTNLFKNLQVLYISTSMDNEYINAQRWEDLIATHMPHLRIFDIQHKTSLFNNIINGETCRDLMNRFATLFWTKRKWFFTHQLYYLERSNYGVFYSIQPYSLLKEFVTCFEDLSDELIYEIFELLKFDHVYKAFYSLNARFYNLIVNSTVPIEINLSSISIL